MGGWVDGILGGRRIHAAGWREYLLRFLVTTGLLLASWLVWFSRGIGNYMTVSMMPSWGGGAVSRLAPFVWRFGHSIVQHYGVAS